MKEPPENRRKTKEQKSFKKQDMVNWSDAAERSSKIITEHVQCIQSLEVIGDLSQSHLVKWLGQNPD